MVVRKWTMCVAGRLYLMKGLTAPSLMTKLNPNIGTAKIQCHLNATDRRWRKWRTKLNKTKSVYTTFTLCRKFSPEVVLHNIRLPNSNSVRYLSFHLDRRLTCKNTAQKETPRTQHMLRTPL